MKRFTCAVCFAAALCATATFAVAQDVTLGKPINIFADPGDFIVELDKNGKCGSAYFHFLRNSKNFQEAVALALTAYSTGSTMRMFVSGCSNDRNIASHAGMSH